VKIFRRAGRREDLLLWLRNVELALETLGYAPEFVPMNEQDNSRPLSWERHGAASNLNCVTGWYQALIEGVFGLECDPGGITVHPLSLAIGDVALHGLRYRNSTWNVSVKNDDRGYCRIRVDGEELLGCAKIPVGYYDGCIHMLDISYDAPRHAKLIHELVNAELLHASVDGDSIQAVIRALGRVDMVYSAPAPGFCLLDGQKIDSVELLPDGTWCALLNCVGEHVVTL
jgi:hypothetical protein